MKLHRNSSGFDVFRVDARAFFVQQLRLPFDVATQVYVFNEVYFFLFQNGFQIFFRKQRSIEVCIRSLNEIRFLFPGFCEKGLQVRYCKKRFSNSLWRGEVNHPTIRCRSFGVVFTSYFCLFSFRWTRWGTSSSTLSLHTVSSSSKRGK